MIEGFFYDKIKIIIGWPFSNIIHQLLKEYDIQTAEDIQDALKDLLGGTIKEMLEAEMEDHLGYEKSERSDNEEDRKSTRLNSSHLKLSRMPSSA